MSVERVVSESVPGQISWEFRELLLPLLSTHLGSGHPAHVWINLQMPITDLPPAELMQEGFEGPK